MFKFQTTTIINNFVDANGVNKIVSTADSLTIHRLGKFKKANITKVYKKAGTAGTAGTAEITSIITGNNEINSGVGNLRLNLIDNIENYKIKINKGIGKVEIDNKEVSDNKIVGTGLNFINISGGIGTIAVNFMESR